jgi:SAM-dependent methyltransferase
MAQSTRHWYTDPTYVATACYPDSTNLQNRANLYHYQQPPLDLVGWALDRLNWRGNERVVDVGCGPGKYLHRLARFPALHLIGFDISRGMLHDLIHEWNANQRQDAVSCIPDVAVADAQHLPLLDACCDVVMAMHMLYHVPDIPQALREIRRVLKIGGTFLVIANRADHLREINELGAAAVSKVAAAPTELFSSVTKRFGLENGEMLLREVFDDVERYEVERPLVIPHPAPVLAYVESTRTVTEKLLPEGIIWNEVMSELQRLVTATIKEQGSFRATSATGLFIGH